MVTLNVGKTISCATEPMHCSHIGNWLVQVGGLAELADSHRLLLDVVLREQARLARHHLLDGRWNYQVVNVIVRPARLPAFRRDNLVDQTRWTFRGESGWMHQYATLRSAWWGPNNGHLLLHKHVFLVDAVVTRQRQRLHSRRRNTQLLMLRELNYNFFINIKKYSILQKLRKFEVWGNKYFKPLM